MKIDGYECWSCYRYWREPEPVDIRYPAGGGDPLYVYRCPACGYLTKIPDTGDDTEAKPCAH